MSDETTTRVRGTLTAEQVREAAHGHYKLRMVLDADGMDAPQVTFDWQEIADELNAALNCFNAETIRNQQERITSLERSLEHYRLEVICYENDVDARDGLIRDMHRELRDLNDGGVPTDCMEHEKRMRELGIEEDA